MQELGNAINESLSDSDRSIAAAIGEIKRAGLRRVPGAFEATIGFNKREDAEDGEEGETIELGAPPAEPTRRKVGKIKLTSQDQKFLRALKISRRRTEGRCQIMSLQPDLVITVNIPARLAGYRTQTSGRAPCVSETANALVTIRRTRQSGVVRNH